MAITIDNVEYDETTLDPSVKNSIVQVQKSSSAIANLKAEILNHEILISSHEYMYEIIDLLDKKQIKKPKYVIYDNASRSFLDVLKHFPNYYNSKNFESE